MSPSITNMVIVNTPANTWRGSTAIFPQIHSVSLLTKRRQERVGEGQQRKRAVNVEIWRFFSPSFQLGFFFSIFFFFPFWPFLFFLLFLATLYCHYYLLFRATIFSIKIILYSINLLFSDKIQIIIYFFTDILFFIIQRRIKLQ